MIVQEVAVRHPDRLRSLVVACSHPGGRLLVPAQPAVVADFVAGSGDDASETARRRQLEIVFHPRSLEQSAAAVEAYESAKKRFPHSAAELAARSTGIAGFDVADRLAGIEVPTLVICGADDLIVPPENSRRIAAAIPRAELVVVPDTGHVFFAQEPAAFNAAILGFFDRH